MPTLPARWVETALGTSVTVSVIRSERHRCNGCGQRRILFAIVVGRTDVIRDPIWMCAPCWGLR